MNIAVIIELAAKYIQAWGPMKTPPRLSRVNLLKLSSVFLNSRVCQFGRRPSWVECPWGWLSRRQWPSMRRRGSTSSRTPSISSRRSRPALGRTSHPRSALTSTLTGGSSMELWSEVSHDVTGLTMFHTVVVRIVRWRALLGVFIMRETDSIVWRRNLWWGEVWLASRWKYEYKHLVFKLKFIVDFHVKDDKHHY